MPRLGSSCILFFILALPLAAANPARRSVASPQTVAEATDYSATSRYMDVLEFVRSIQKVDAELRVEIFATTNEGRELPLVIAGPAGVTTPAAAVRSGLPVVFIMANIHGGEVEGKEASLMVLRDLATGSLQQLRSRMVILIAPIYNADGNERILTTNRTTQNGPRDGVGARVNAQELDLNRDYVKLESPEAQGLVANVIDRWDPLLTVDLHTTNGSYHGYELTYSPPLNPNTPVRIVDFERDVLLPRITREMKTRHQKSTYYYGNFKDQLKPHEGWYSFDARPRFGNNYVGLRNRFAILSEAYSYIDFRARVEVTYQFLHAILRVVDKHGKGMMAIAAAEDRRVSKGQVDRLGVRSRISKWRDRVPVLWEKTVPMIEAGGVTDPETGQGALRRTGEIVPVVMPDFGIFEATASAEVPFVYLIDSRFDSVAKNLHRHGIVVETLAKTLNLEVSEFQISQSRVSERSFQGHRERAMDGSWHQRSAEVAEGTFVVRMNQPLARLVFSLLEPQSEDSLFTWNFFDAAELEAGAVSPVRKLMRGVPLPSVSRSRRGSGKSLP